MRKTNKNIRFIWIFRIIIESIGIDQFNLMFMLCGVYALATSFIPMNQNNVHLYVNRERRPDFQTKSVDLVIDMHAQFHRKP